MYNLHKLPSCVQYFNVLFGTDFKSFYLDLCCVYLDLQILQMYIKAKIHSLLKKIINIWDKVVNIPRNIREYEIF